MSCLFVFTTREVTNNRKRCRFRLMRFYWHCPHQGPWNGTMSVRPSVCPSTGPQQQTRCCRFAAVGPAGRRYRLIAVLLLDYSLPRLRTKFGERAFSHAGPATWNALPDHIRTMADPVKFRKLLKSLYFSQAFNMCWLLCFSLCFSTWLTFVMHLWPRFS